MRAELSRVRITGSPAAVAAIEGARRDLCNVGKITGTLELVAGGDDAEVHVEVELAEA